MKIKHEEDATKARQRAYPNIGDQLDAIFKAFDELQKRGMKLPAETEAWLHQVREVKRRHPKPKV